MKPLYPRLRVHHTDGRLVLSDGVYLCFFMPHPLQEVAAHVRDALEVYLRAVGPEALRWYVDPDGELRPLDDKGWRFVTDLMLNRDLVDCSLELAQVRTGINFYHFEYHAFSPEDPVWDSPDVVSSVSFRLPTEYLEEHGPARVRALALELAQLLPFSFGYASLAFLCQGCMTPPTGRTTRQLFFRYLGFDIHHLTSTTVWIGPFARGAYWLTFLGQPLLEYLGGLEALREPLSLPGVSVEDLGEGKALVALGEWPAVGDVEAQEDMTPYRALSQVLEPCLYIEHGGIYGLSVEERTRWARRFLDSPSSSNR